MASKRSPQPRRIDAILRQLFGEKRWRQGLLGAQIQLQWAEIVGPEIAAHAAPQRLLRGRLLVHCDHDVWRTELMYLREELIARINEALGEPAVKEIWLK